MKAVQIFSGRRGRFTSLIACLCLLALLAAPIGGAEALPSISGGTAAVHAGDTVSIPVTIVDNPGVIALRLQVSYDADALTLTAVKDAGLLGKTVHSASTATRPFILYWNNPVAEENYQGNGTLATLTFRVNPDARAGDYAVTLSCGEEDAVNADVDPVAFSVSDGVITVICDHPRATWVIDREATCLETGVEALTCADCGKVLKTRETPLGRHRVEVWTVDAEATLAATGKRHGECSVCHQMVEETVPKRVTEVQTQTVDGNDLHEDPRDAVPSVGVSVKTAGDATLPGNTVLTVKDITEMISPQDIHRWNDWVNSVAMGKTIAAVYAFDMTLDGEPYDPSFPVTVTVTPDGVLAAQYAAWQVVKLGENDAIILMDATDTGKGVSFETDDLHARYALIGIRQASGWFSTPWHWLVLAIVLAALSAIVIYILSKKTNIFNKRGKGKNEK